MPVVSLTNVLLLLVLLPGLGLQVELVLVGAQLQQILAGLIAVRLEEVLYPV